MLGEPVALPAQFLQLLAAQRVAQQFVGIAPLHQDRREDADCSSRGCRPSCRSTSVKAFMAAPSSDTSRRISACAPARAPAHQLPAASPRDVAVEQRRAQRAVGTGADQSGQGDLVGAPHRNDRQQADQSRRAVLRRRGVAPCAERRRGGAAARRSVHRQFPCRQIIAVRLDGAFGQCLPFSPRNLRPSGANAMRSGEAAGSVRACPWHP